jgi:hypothetical protein
MRSSWTDALTVEKLNPLDFEAGNGEEPKNDDVMRPEIHLAGATLQQDRMIELAFEAPETVNGLTLRVMNFSQAQPLLSLRLRQASRGHTSIQLTDNQLAQIQSAATCEIAGILERARIISNRMALVQLNQLLKERAHVTGLHDRMRKISETGEELIPYLDSLSSVREVVEFLDHCSIRFEDGEISDRRLGRSFWKARDPFVSDIPSHWLSEPVANSGDDLRDAIWRFVLRHQQNKLGKHVRRGNLNGLPNFLDVFRTLNGLLITFNTRAVEGKQSVMPHGYVSTGILKNLAFLMGEEDDEGEYQPGFIDSIKTNFEGDQALVRERLQQERVPEMLRAAVEAMIEIRLTGFKHKSLDNWSMAQLKKASDWIERQGLPAPSADDIKTARQEYSALKFAA